MKYILATVGLWVVAFVHLQIGHDLSVTQQWGLITGQVPQSFAEFQFVYSSLPRVLLAIMVGAVMGLAGSILQQLLQNPLVSPMTLGAASGAWLGVLLLTIFAPPLVATMGPWAAVTGSLLAVLLVMAIAGRHGLRGLPIILAGMAVNLLLGAISSALILLNDQYAQNMFIWGAGDLAQTDWQWVEWLLPRLWLVPVVVVLAARPLTLMRLGDSAAQGRGISLVPVMLALFVASLWLTSVVITAVGLIGFIGLLTPNMARMMGSRTARDELVFCLLLGALLLLATDMIALQFSQWSRDIVPSGAAAALIGAPALIWLARSKLRGLEQSNRQLPGGRLMLHPLTPWVMGLMLIVFALSSIMASPGITGWQFAWPDSLVLSLRWPRVVAALAAGVGLAVAGVIMQRLIRNPLASPDLLGLSAGATLALLFTVMLVGGSIQEAGPLVAFAGSAVILFVLMWLGRKHNYSPGILALTGIALAALLDAVVQFILARGGQDTTAVIGWLSGSTYNVSEQNSLLLLVGCSLGLIVGFASARALTLISIDDGFAVGRGLNLSRARMGLLLVAAMLCAVVTSIIGPIAFVGLLAPHIASLLGARKAILQLLVAALAGGLLMVSADWVGRTIIYPMQIPAGLLASVVGGTYFICLLVRRRLS